jgi:hypothetical protein
MESVRSLPNFRSILPDNTAAPSKLAHAVRLLTSVTELPCSNPGRNTRCRGVVDFPQSHQTNVAIVPEIGYGSFLPLPSQLIIH